jgi:hypothetical protein
MHPVLNRNLFFVKEHVGFFKAASNYDILDPQTNQVIMECREERLGVFTKLLRFTDYKRNTPFDIQIRTPDGAPVLSAQRGGPAGWRISTEAFFDRRGVHGLGEQRPTGV